MGWDTEWQLEGFFYFGAPLNIWKFEVYEEPSGYQPLSYHRIHMTPKLFSRIQRFQKTRLLIHRDPSPDWASLAIDLGYFDQSHLINEFREFSGLNPTDYIDRHNSLIEHVNR